MACESEAKATYVRLDTTLLERLDHYADRLAAERPGFRPTRSDVIRILLYKALEAEAEN